MALWGGRFEGGVATSTQEFGASLPVDKHLYKQDIAGSKAHAGMLAKQGIISDSDAQAITEHLGETLWPRVQERIEAGKFAFDINDEDIHMAIESELTRRIGEAGKRLHTGRSRNDQVATDTRLAVKALTKDLMEANLNLRHVLVEAAEANKKAILPGMTHLQHAQPVLFSHHLLAYYWMFTRDYKRIVAAFEAADASPLGAAALAGTTYPLDRVASAHAMGFKQIIPNSLDAVSDRDFLLDLHFACSTMAMPLSRLAEEIVLWSSSEFGFITLSDSFSTGSSIMPQKKNPDVTELIRGKTGRVYGDLNTLLVMMKGIPLAYNKDMQEDKEAIFDAVDTLELCLKTVTPMLDTMKTIPANMRRAAAKGFINATDCADYLTKKGMPFRDAYKLTGCMVSDCIAKDKTLEELTLDEFKGYSSLFEKDIYEAIDLVKCCEGRTSYGGPSEASVNNQIALANAQLDAWEEKNA